MKRGKAARPTVDPANSNTQKQKEKWPKRWSWPKQLAKFIHLRQLNEALGNRKVYYGSAWRTKVILIQLKKKSPLLIKFRAQASSAYHTCVA